MLKHKLETKLDEKKLKHFNYFTLEYDTRK